MHHASPPLSFYFWTPTPFGAEGASHCEGILFFATWHVNLRIQGGDMLSYNIIQSFVMASRLSSSPAWRLKDTRSNVCVCGLFHMKFSLCRGYHPKSVNNRDGTCSSETDGCSAKAVNLAPIPISLKNWPCPTGPCGRAPSTPAATRLSNPKLTSAVMSASPGSTRTCT